MGLILCAAILLGTGESQAYTQCFEAIMKLHQKEGAPEDKSRMRRKSWSSPASSHSSQHSPGSALLDETPLQARRQTLWVHYLQSQQAHVGSITAHKSAWAGDKPICA